MGRLGLLCVKLQPFPFFPFVNYEYFYTPLAWAWGTAALTSHNVPDMGPRHCYEYVNFPFPPFAFPFPIITLHPGCLLLLHESGIFAHFDPYGMGMMGAMCPSYPPFPLPFLSFFLSFFLSLPLTILEGGCSC